METWTENSLACDLALWSDLKDLVDKAEAELAELCDEAHPHSKIADHTNKSGSVIKRGRGRPPTHGLSRTSIYRSYREARRRCTDPKCPDYERYGGRGIEFRIPTVSDLFDAIGDRPPNTTLDRIDPDGHYEVENVRWASPKEQANNRCRPSEKLQQGPRMDRVEGVREAYLETARHWGLSVKGSAIRRV